MFRTVLIAALSLIAACTDPPPDVGPAFGPPPGWPPVALEGPNFGSAQVMPLKDGAVAMFVGEARVGLTQGDLVEITWRQAGAVQIDWGEVAVARGDAPLGDPELTVIGARDVTQIMETTPNTTVVAAVEVTSGQPVEAGDGLWFVFATHQLPGLTFWTTVVTSNSDPIGSGVVAVNVAPGWRPTAEIARPAPFKATLVGTQAQRPVIVRGRAWGTP